jgi:hypothetical protein
MEYLIKGETFGISYRSLKEHYIRFCEMSDEEFMKEIVAAAHLACIISYFKELPHDDVTSDVGILHELIHLIHIPHEPTIDLQQIREKFKTFLQLV